MYAVMFEDNEQFADVRRRQMRAHLAFLEENAQVIRAAGPLIDTSGDRPAGGMWLVTADSVEEVEKLVRADPFWPTGLRRSVRILAWKLVFSKLS